MNDYALEFGFGILDILQNPTPDRLDIQISRLQFLGHLIIPKKNFLSNG